MSTVKLQEVRVSVLGIQNCDLEGFGRYGDHIEKWGVGFDLVRPYRNETLPHWSEFDALLRGGTPISANDVEHHTFLRNEFRYLEEAVSAGVPCFGICCGAQLLARILGAKVRRCKQLEIGCVDVQLTDEGAGDEILAGFPKTFPVFQWHGDEFEMPGKARHLVTGKACRHQMFRDGSVVGILFHLEITPVDVADWADVYDDELDAVNGSKQALVRACEASDSVMDDLSARLLGNFLRKVAGIPLEEHT